jgi:hypothetical protein
MQDIEEVKTEKVKAEMAKASLENFLTNKDSEVVNSSSFISQLQDERESLRSELEAMRMKNERDRTNLKFYKGEYIGFEVSRKTFYNHWDNMQREFLQKEKRQNEIIDEKSTRRAA